MTGRSLYLYAVLPTEPAVEPGTGIDGAPLRVVASGDLAAVVHDHEGEPYAGDDDTARRRVLEHGATVDRLWAQRPSLLPCTFDVLVRGDDGPAEDRLRGWLDAERPALHDRLAAVTGRVELQAEVALDPALAAADDPGVRAARAELAPQPPGVQRLLRKRVERLEHDVAAARAERLHSRWRPRLAALSAELHEPDRRRPAAAAVEVLRLALLVDGDRVDDVGQALADLAAEQSGVSVTFLGPWPPYSFAQLPSPAAVRA